MRHGGRKGRSSAATDVLATIKRQRLSGDEPLRLDLLLAEIALARHDSQTALRLTTQPNVVVPAALQLRLLELRARPWLPPATTGVPRARACRWMPS